jgi:hypothetical protein
MAESVAQAVLRVVEAGGEQGVAMGKIVDELVNEGWEEKEVESAIWHLMQHRRLTPNGFVARTLKKRSLTGNSTERVYEFVLIPWSPALDRQLDFKFEKEAGE